MAKRPRTIRDFWKIRTCKFLESDCDPLDKAELAGQVIRSLGIDEDDRPSCPATDAEVAILEACFQALRCLRAQPRTSDLQKEITALEGQVKELTTEMEEMKSRLSSMEAERTRLERSLADARRQAWSGRIRTRVAEAEVEECRTKIAKFEACARDAKIEAEELRSKLAKSNARAKAAEIEVEKSRCRVAQSDARAKDAEIEAEESKERLFKHKRRAESVRDEALKRLVVVFARVEEGCGAFTSCMKYALHLWDSFDVVDDNSSSVDDNQGEVFFWICMNQSLHELWFMRAGCLHMDPADRAQVCFPGSLLVLTMMVPCCDIT